MTQQSLDWFPHTYGEDRVRRIVLEPRVGGQHYEDWGHGSGHLYGEVTVYDPPRGRCGIGRRKDAPVKPARPRLRAPVRASGAGPGQHVPGRGARGGYPGRGGGPWLCRTLLPSGLQAVVVPSGFTISVHPHRCTATR